MRIHLKAALVAGLSVTPIGATAAPTSMLNTMPKGDATQPAEPGRGNWFTKWFRGETTPQPMGYQQSGAAGAPVMAYQPPPSTPQPTQAALSGGAGSGWPGATPTASAAATPVPAVAAYPAAAGGQTLAGPAPTMAPAPGRSDCKSLREEGHAKDRVGDLVAAEAIYRRAIGADPTSAAAVNDLGLCLARQGRLAPSIATFRQAILMRPDKQLYRNNIATVLVEEGQTEEAMAHLKTVYPPATAHYNLSQLMARAGDQDGAVAQLQLALTADPSMTPARQALAQLTPQPPAMAEAKPATETAPQERPAAQPTFMPTQVAAMPQRVATVPTAPQPTPAPPAGVPSFPRLLPPVLDR